MVALVIASGAALSAQLVTPTAIPRNEKPPVVFLNGWQQGCEGDTSFASTYGTADQILARDGRASLFFNNCEQARNAPIEQIGAAFRTYLEGLRYSDGTPVPQVDVIAHSMGGLIVRSYLSGKQAERNTFQPPTDIRIRKAVFLAVPFFGSVLAASPLAANENTIQVQQLRPGSTFLWDLATWNQGMDDLRGIDAVAIAGIGGSGVVSGLENFDDSTVAITSASLDFALPDRTRVLSMCHTNLTGLLSIGCRGSAPPIARWNDAAHEAARISVSFLNGTNDWRNIGQSNKDATNRGGVYLQVRDAEDRIVNLRDAQNASVRSNEIAWTDRQITGSTQFRLTQESGAEVNVTSDVPDGATLPLTVTTGGPNVAAIIPSAAAVTPRAVAPGMFVSIYGTNLSTATEQAQALPYPTSLGGTQVLVNGNVTGLHYASPQQVNAVVPEDASGLIRISVRTSQGLRNVNVLVEPAVPALFGAALNAVSGALVTPQAPIARGEYVALYLTGLGRTERRADGLDHALLQPQVTVGGKPCNVLYAGRAPGYVGLDQVNCQIAADAETGSVTASVTSGKRTGTATIPVR